MFLDSWASYKTVLAIKSQIFCNTLWAHTLENEDKSASLGLGQKDGRSHLNKDDVCEETPNQVCDLCLKRLSKRLMNLRTIVKSCDLA